MIMKSWQKQGFLFFLFVVFVAFFSFLKVETKAATASPNLQTTLLSACYYEPGQLGNSYPEGYSVIGRYLVKNVGDADAGQFATDARFNNINTVGWGRSGYTVDFLGAGQYKTLYFRELFAVSGEVMIPESVLWGDLTKIIFFADTSNDVSESNESDNSYTLLKSAIPKCGTAPTPTPPVAWTACWADVENCTNYWANMDSVSCSYSDDHINFPYPCYSSSFCYQKLGTATPATPTPTPTSAPIPTPTTSCSSSCPVVTLKSSGTGCWVQLSWRPVAGAAGYKIYRNSTYKTTTATSYRWNWLPCNNTSLYKVTAVVPGCPEKTNCPAYAVHTP
jgi:hypothetical protein